MHRYLTSHSGQLSLAIPPWVGATSTSESWAVNKHSLSAWRLQEKSLPSAPPSNSPKCLTFGHWLTLCNLYIHLLTHLLTNSTSKNLLWHFAKSYYGGTGLTQSSWSKDIRIQTIMVSLASSLADAMSYWRRFSCNISNQTFFVLR